MKTMMLVLGMLVSTAAFAAPGGGHGPMQHQNDGPARAQVQRGDERRADHGRGRFERPGEGRRFETRGKKGHPRGHGGRCGTASPFGRTGRR